MFVRFNRAIIDASDVTSWIIAEPANGKYPIFATFKCGKSMAVHIADGLKEANSIMGKIWDGSRMEDDMNQGVNFIDLTNDQIEIEPAEILVAKADPGLRMH